MSCLSRWIVNERQDSFQASVVSFQLPSDVMITFCNCHNDNSIVGAQEINPHHKVTLTAR